MRLDLDFGSAALALFIGAGDRKPSLARVASLAVAPVYLLDPTDSSAFVDEDKSDAEGIAKVHTRHGGQAVHEVSALPHRGGIFAVDRVDEAVFRGQQTRRHARVEDENGEGEQVQQGHGSTHGRESGEGRRHVIVECDETRSHC